MDVTITESDDTVRTVTTDANGTVTTNVPLGTTIIDVDNTDLPAGSVQTGGTDPTTVNVPLAWATDSNGYQ